jgi:BirA family transcriptional regulator, biotin operon repressor / biotin---[acetyl-CoA-carboxylase] ligase
VESPESSEELILSFLAEGGDEYVSGAALSDKLGLSRTAVWKHVEQLRRLGYRIDAQPSRGYRLIEVPDRLTALELAPLLSTREVGRTIHHFDTLGSTNTEAFALARAGAAHGEVVIAEGQTEGRGRRGRAWISPPGANLSFSLILRPDVPPARAPEVTLLAAVAVAQTLHEAGAAAAIKWPNDVQIDGRKVAGVLTELAADVEQVHFLVLGVGVNLNSRREEFPPEVAALATSLMEARRQRVPRALFTAALFGKLEEWLDRWEAEGFEPVRAAWKEMSATLGRQVVVRSEGTVRAGLAEDIDESGALLVRIDGRLERCLAGDVELARSGEER